VEGQPPRFADWERELRARLGAGDELALAEAYDQFSPMVYGLAVRVTGDRSAAEDVTQEVFLHLWQRPAAFDPDRGRLRTWLATMAHHRAVDHLRRAGVRDRYAARAAVEREPTPPPNPEEAAVAAAVAKRVRVAVDELPDAQRTAVLLAYFEGRTFRQVAQLTGVPEGTAKSRLRLGLRRIAARLHSEGLPGEW
jgi:RNA polymerase sigma-70 factor (ECF subfamily)